MIKTLYNIVAPLSTSFQKLGTATVTSIRRQGGETAVGVPGRYIYHAIYAAMEAKDIGKRTVETAQKTLDIISGVVGRSTL